MTNIDSYHSMSSNNGHYIMPEEANDYEYYMVPENYSSTKDSHHSSGSSMHNGARYQTAKEVEYHRALALRYRVILTYTR
ncbi:hypothetical protein K7432_008621 [Basidiobolus ranarum]|uniref:Uncharacterized protein n=1 Tax=Basidiobolus ranarum TaxID=34480 RepID=A0ABR2VYB5_9FUNG